MNNTNIFQVPLQKHLQLISYVPQQISIVHGSVCKNITYGSSIEWERYLKEFNTEETEIQIRSTTGVKDFDPTVSVKFPTANKKTLIDRLKESIQTSQCGEMFEKSRLSLKTTIGGVNGASLSSGEAQRITIARALYRDCPLMLMDEPSSALDVNTEKLLQEELKRQLKTRNQTVLIVAHRLNTLNWVDRILVFDNGQIVEDGTLQDLLSDPRSRFSVMWNLSNKLNGAIQ